MMPTEIVCQVSQEEDKQILQDHFSLFYQVLADCKLVPEANFEIVDGVKRALSGIPSPFHNALIGAPQGRNSDACIDAQINYFGEAKMPFIWCLNEGADSAFQQKLLERGFKEGGVFQGMMSHLDLPIPDPEIPEDCTFERVQDEAALEEYNEVVSKTFGLEGAARDLYKNFLRNSANHPEHPIFHWIARKEGKAVSTLSSFIKGDVVSFWNGASLPEVRCQGFMTALGSLATKDAMARGARMGITYLMAEAMALGICTNLGYQSKWRFHVLLAPALP